MTLIGSLFMAAMRLLTENQAGTIEGNQKVRANTTDIGNELRLNK